MRLIMTVAFQEDSACRWASRSPCARAASASASSAASGSTDDTEEPRVQSELPLGAGPYPEACHHCRRRRLLPSHSPMGLGHPRHGHPLGLGRKLLVEDPRIAALLA